MELRRERDALVTALDGAEMALRNSTAFSERAGRQLEESTRLMERAEARIAELEALKEVEIGTGEAWRARAERAEARVAELERACGAQGPVLQRAVEEGVAEPQAEGEGDDRQHI